MRFLSSTTCAICAALSAIALPLSAQASMTQSLKSDSIAIAKSVPANPVTQPQLAEAIVLLDEVGYLEEGDLVLGSDSSLYDTYTFEGEVDQTVTISATSEDFDTYLVVFDDSENELARIDDIDSDNINSEITLTLPYDGLYVVVVNGFDSTSEGEYTVMVVAEPKY
jgi:hypothetical protein